MRVEIEKGTAKGRASVPSSKSLTHRHIICAALATGTSVLSNVSFSEDILATLDCVAALGATITRDNQTLVIEGIGENMTVSEKLPTLYCRESGSTLRFLLPLAMLFGGGVFRGSERLVSRGIGIYKDLFSEFADFKIEKQEIRVKGRLSAGQYRVKGDVSSQFISGLLFALPLLKEDSVLEILPPFESRAYVDLTCETLCRFGVEIDRRSAYCFYIRGGQKYSPVHTSIEGDWSQAAFFFGLNFIGGDVLVDGLRSESLQSDRECLTFYEKMKKEYLEADLSCCPDLAPILFAMASVSQGACFTGTRRLAIKESDRATTMASELRKFGAKITVSENSVKIEKSELCRPSEPLFGHGDHRIVMALSVLATKFGAVIENAEAVQKSYPMFFDDLRRLGLEIREYDD